MNQNGCIFGGESARPTGNTPQKAPAPMDDFPPIFCDECASPVRHQLTPPAHAVRLSVGIGIMLPISAFHSHRAARQK